MLTKKNYIRRGDIVDQKKLYIRRGDRPKETIYKEGRQCSQKKTIRRGDNVHQKKLYKEGRKC